MRQRRASSRDRATQSSGETVQTTNVQEDAIKRFIEENGDNLKVIQVEDHHPDKGDKHCNQVWVNQDLKDWHPKWTTLRLTWTLSGKWVKAPKHRDTTGDEIFTYRIARIEKYIDSEGRVREALAYGDRDVELMVWYNLEELRTTFTNWRIPEVSIWQNTRI